MRIEEKLFQALKESSKTLALAESCTGGLIGHRITNLPGSSDFFMGSAVCYSNEAKTRLIGVPEATLKKHGAVSTEVAIAMAKGARKKFRADFALGITGIAGPAGGTVKKPVGLVYIAAASHNECICLQYEFTGDRTSIKKQASTKALHLLTEFIY